MPYRVCSQCQRQGRLLEHVSQGAYVDYYRCDHCGHVWSHEKGKPESKPRDVTIPLKTRTNGNK